MLFNRTKEPVEYFVVGPRHFGELEAGERRAKHRELRKKIEESGFKPQTYFNFKAKISDNEKSKIEEQAEAFAAELREATGLTDREIVVTYGSYL